MHQRRWWAFAGVIVVLAATLTTVLLVRSGGDRSASVARPQASDSSPRVVLPGRPGESAKVVTGDQVPPLEQSTYNTVDTAFMQMMIAHHEQAIRMADLAPQRASNTQLRNLAERISVAQKVEIAVYKAWLTERKLPENDPKHNHATMPGMHPETAVAALAGTKGADFDRRFVDMMIFHHEGARQMAADVLRGGSDQRINEIANELAVEQAAEIRRMRDLDVT